MSVSFARAVADGLRSYGVTVHFWEGWESRGNGMTSDYQGAIMHHTATAFGMAPRVLVDGRSDLSGPLCNSAGNADGSVTIIAAGPANHAGASGGRSMGPLPVTRSFNRFVWGHEIVYPGNQPMNSAQYSAALVLGGVIGAILKRPNAEWIRGHAETSITGKWDPGYAPGKAIDMNRFRADIVPELQRRSGKDAAPTPIGDDDLTPEQAAQLSRIENELLGPRGPQGQIQGWGTTVGPRTHTAMLVDLVNWALGLRPSRYPGSTVKLGLADAVMDNNSAMFQLLPMKQEVAGLRATVTELSKAVAAVAAGQKLDAAKLVDDIQAAVSQALAEGTVDVDITVGGRTTPESSIEPGSIQAQREGMV